VSALLARFPGSRAAPHYLLAAILRARLGFFPRGRADRWDRRLFEAFPFLGRLAAQVLLRIGPAESGRGEG
jgi:hypothetical protein